MCLKAAPTASNPDTIGPSIPFTPGTPGQCLLTGLSSAWMPLPAVPAAQSSQSLPDRFLLQEGSLLSQREAKLGSAWLERGEELCRGQSVDQAPCTAWDSAWNKNQKEII